MLYKITGKKIDVGAALQGHVKSVVDTIIEKYAERPTDATIVFSRSLDEFVCEVSVHLSTGLTAQAKAHDREIYAAFNAASEKMETQLRRYKRRLKDHHRERAQPVELSLASSYILATQKIQSLSVGEAVMQMELAGAPVLVFRNEGHNGVNVVYRREDGNIGWVDPG
jgi:ribosomal subunit interface protein